MEKVLILVAIMFFVATILVGSDTIKVNKEWISVGIAYGLLAVGCVLFGIALSL